MRIVLVVDDEPMLRMLAAEMLEEAGHIVVVLDRATDAIIYCDDPANAVSTIVTGINMPGDLDGLDLARHIRATRPEIRVVVTSGRYDRLPGDLRADVTFLPKPWTSALLLRAINKEKV